MVSVCVSPPPAALSDVSTLISNVSSEVNAVTMTVSSITAELDSILMDLTTAGNTCSSSPIVDCSPIMTTMNAVNMARSSIPAVSYFFLTITILYVCMSSPAFNPDHGIWRKVSPTKHIIHTQCV